MDVNKIKEIAINEVVNPTFELTKQYLKSNNLTIKNGTPIIEDIEINENGVVSIYFPIEKQHFYFVVYIEDMTLKWMDMSAGNRVQLLVCSNDIDAEQIIDYLGIEPTSRWNKNDRVGRSGKRKNSGIIYQPIDKMTGRVEDKLSKLLDDLLPYKKSILELSLKASLEIQIAYYGHKNEMWGIHLDKENVNKLSDLDLPLDVDLYAGGNDIE